MKRRKDRLLDLISILRDGKVHRAQDLAVRLNVSTRSLYRDMDTLVASGVPVLGERGVGYQMTAPVTLPPINLTMDELEALHLGVAVMTEASDPTLQISARSLANKLDHALPEDGTATSTGWGLAVFPFADAAAGIRFMPAIRTAIRQRKKLRITTRNMTGGMVQSVIRPLKLEYWGRVWTCRAWCETGKDFRGFRLDNFLELIEMTETFQEEQGKRMVDFTSGSTH